MGEGVDNLPPPTPASFEATAPVVQHPFGDFSTLIADVRTTNAEENATNLTRATSERYLKMLNEADDVQPYDFSKISASFDEKYLTPPSNKFEVNVDFEPEPAINMGWLKNALHSYVQHRESECGYTSAGTVCGFALEEMTPDQFLLAPTHTFTALYEIEHNNISYSFGIIQDYKSTQLADHLKHSFIGAQPYLNEIKENIENFGEKYLGPKVIQALILAQQLDDLKPTGVGIQITGNFDLTNILSKNR